MRFFMLGREGVRGGKVRNGAIFGHFALETHISMHLFAKSLVLLLTLLGMLSALPASAFVYGPDRSGGYGGAQGIGGLDAVVTENTGTVNGVTNNYFGDALAAPGSTTAWSSVVGGYGAMPGSSAVNSSLQANWRGKYIDPTGFYYMGARYYEPNSGRFLSADPLGQAGSLDLYSYCNGDPVNGLDPDGRFGKQVDEGLTTSVTGQMNYDPTFGSNLGNDIGNILVGGRDGAVNGIGGEINTFTLGNVQGAFGTDPNSQEYSQGEWGAGIGAGLLTFAGGIAAAPVVWGAGMDAIGSSPTLMSMYNGATAFSNSNLVLALGGGSVFAGGSTLTLNLVQEADQSIPESGIPAAEETPVVVQQQMVQQAQAQASGGYFIQSGVRRSLASLYGNADTVPAIMYREGQAPVNFNVPLNQLFSPKTEVPLDDRFLNIQPPIITPIEIEPLGLPNQPSSVPLSSVRLVPPNG